jgi:hypothetical protein
MGIVELIQDAGDDKQVVRARRVRKALDDLTASLKKKAAKLRNKLEKDDLSHDDHKHLTAKLAVVEAQIKRGHDSKTSH